MKGVAITGAQLQLIAAIRAVDIVRYPQGGGLMVGVWEPGVEGVRMKRGFRWVRLLENGGLGQVLSQFEVKEGFRVPRGFNGGNEARMTREELELLLGEASPETDWEEMYS
jgi:hypothetical protein